MGTQRLLSVCLLVVPFAVMGGCGSDSASPFPAGVQAVLNDLTADVRLGNGTLDPSLTGGAVVDNPFDRDTDLLATIQVAGSGDDHSGTVAAVDYQLTETRNADGSGQITATIVDAADSAREFLSYSATFGVPAITYLAPPIGATDFLDANGIGQSFMVMIIERTIVWSRDFTNDPGSGGTTLVDFDPAGCGCPIPPAQEVPLSGTITQKETFLVEFNIKAGPSGSNVTEIVATYDIGDAKEVRRNGSGLSVTRIVHRHTVSAGSPTAQMNARSNAAATVVVIGTDADPQGTINDGDELNVSNGQISGGIATLGPADYINFVDNAGNTLAVLNDGVPVPTDGDFDGVDTYDLRLNIKVSTGPGGLDNGTVEVSVLIVESEHMESAAMDDVDHPVVDEHFLYGMVEASTETGTVIFR